MTTDSLNKLLGSAGEKKPGKIIPIGKYGALEEHMRKVAGDDADELSDEDLKRRLEAGLGAYSQELKDAPHDPAKLAIASMVNEKMLHDIATEIADDLKDAKGADGKPVRTPSRQELKEMQAFVAKYKKKHPLAKERAIRRAVESRFKIKILDPQPAQPATDEPQGSR